MKHSRTGEATSGVVKVLRNQARRATAIVAVFGLACAAGAQEHVIVNFDKAGLDEGVHAGNIFLADGVRITSCTAPDAITAGATITLTGLQPWFELWRYGWAVSAPNYAVALNAGTTDMLLSFTVPITSVEMNLDFYPNEAMDNDRLVILESTGSNTFKVLKSVVFTDENGAPPATHVGINLGGEAFSYVLFQTLTELEGFDDLEFETTGPIPEPPDEGPPGPAPPGSGGWAGGGSGGSKPTPPTTNENGSGGDSTNKNASTDGGQTPANDNSAPDQGGSSTIGNQSAGDVNLNSNPGTASDGGSGGGACGAPIAIIMLCGLLLVRLLGQSSAGRAER